MNSSKIKAYFYPNYRKGFTLIELIAVIAILAILATIIIPNVIGYIGKANISTCAENKRIANSQYTTYLVNGGVQITNGTIGTQFLVNSQYLNKEISCPSGGTYKWMVDSKGDAYISCSIHDIQEGVGNVVLNSMISLLHSFAGKTSSQIATILGSNSISNSTYRSYILANTFKGTWPSFPLELQGKVPSGNQLRVMPFSYSAVPDDPIIYASTITSDNWSSSHFYYPGKGWYRYKNSYGYYANLTFSSMTGTTLKQTIDQDSKQWVLVE